MLEPSCIPVHSAQKAASSHTSLVRRATESTDQDRAARHHQIVSKLWTPKNINAKIRPAPVHSSQELFSPNPVPRGQMIQGKVTPDMIIQAHADPGQATQDR